MLALFSVAALVVGVLIVVLSLPGLTSPRSGFIHRHDPTHPQQLTGAQTPCSTVTIGQPPGASVMPGSTLKVSAAASGCSTPLYRFWVLEPGRRWSMVQDYGTATTYAWTPPATMGQYTFEVDARDSSQSTGYDAIANVVFQVAGCTRAQLTTKPDNPGRHGTAINLAATSTCPGKATYRFWVRRPGETWRVVRDYSSQSNFSWTPSDAGTYEVEIDVRDEGSSAAYEATSTIKYAVT